MDPLQFVLDARPPFQYGKENEQYSSSRVAGGPQRSRYYDRHEELIQACANPAEPTVLIREFRALESAALEYPKATKRMLTLTRGTIQGESVWKAPG